MTACTSFLAFFAEQMLAFAVKMHSRPGRWPSEARRAEGASTRSAQSKAAKRLEARGHAQRASATPEHRAAEGEGGAQRRNTAQALAQSGAKTSGRVILVDKPKVCQRSATLPPRLKSAAACAFWRITQSLWEQRLFRAGRLYKSWNIRDSRRPRPRAWARARSAAKFARASCGARECIGAGKAVCTA